jgi:hypothetical protein
MPTVSLRAVLFGVLLLIAPDALAQCTDSFLVRQETVLSQDTRILDEVEYAMGLPDGSWIITTKDPGIFHFSEDGQFLRQFGRAGRGPYEYERPVQVRSDGETVAVWDEGNRKVSVFSIDGTPVREWTGFARPVSDFEVVEDTLYAYSSGSATTDFVSIYAYAHERRGTPVDQLGQAPEGHRPLSFLGGSGGLTYDRTQDRLFYVSPAATTVHVYNPRTGQQQTWSIDDEAFDIEPVRSSQRNLTNPLIAAEQAFQSSRFYVIHAFENRLLSVLQHGQLKYNRSIADAVSAQAQGDTQGAIDLGGVETYTRRFHVHLHTTEAEPLGCEVVSFEHSEISSDSPIRGRTPRGFVIPMTRTTPTDVEYVLVEYEAP